MANNAGLDLVNTRVVQNGTPVDLITSFADLISWSAAAGLIDQNRAGQLRGKWSDTAEADRVLDRTFRLRDSLAAISKGILRGRLPTTAHLEEVNSLLRQKSGWFEVREGEDGYAKTFHSDLDDIDGLLVPIAESFADLLCFGDLTQVKKCQAEECVLVFYDTSKNHRRRWCSMAACGNRSKVNAFYRRKSVDL